MTTTAGQDMGTSKNFQLSDDDLATLRRAVPEKAKHLEADTLAFWRELPRLLAEGQEGRCALVHGGKLISLWDTVGDATQAGYEKYGVDGVFVTAPVRETELLRVREFLAQEAAKRCPS